MSLTKETKVNQIEIVGEYKTLIVRELIIIKDNGNVISQSYHRRPIPPNFDTTNETQEIRDIAATVHTQAVKDAYQAHLDSLRTGE